MLLTAYGRSVLVYKMYHVSFLRDIYPFQRTLWKLSFVKFWFLTLDAVSLYRKIKHNGFFKPTPHSPYIRLVVSPEMDRTCKNSVLPGL